MTNLQDLNGEGDALGRRFGWDRYLLVLPLAVGGVVSLLLLLAWVIPQLQTLNQDNQRLDQKQATAARLPLLRQQQQKMLVAQERADRQKAQLFALIAGSGDLATFLTQVDREAQRHGVQLDVLQPAAVAPPDATKSGAASKKSAAKDGEPTEAAAAPDPLASAGLDRERLTLSVRGSFPNLLAFMRAIERLSLMVQQSDLGLQLQDQRGGQQKDAAQLASPTQLSVTVTLYRQKSGVAQPNPNPKSS